MPPGRPPKPGTAEEKAIAQRERVRQNVRAYRARKKLEKHGKNGTAWSEPFDSDLYEHGSPGVYLIAGGRSPSPMDMEQLSNKPRIDLTFEFLPCVAQEFERSYGRYPWTMAMKHFAKMDRMVDLAILAGGAIVLGKIHHDDRLVQMGRVSYCQAIQKVQYFLGCSELSPEHQIMLAAALNGLMAFETADGSPRMFPSSWGSHVLACARLMEAAGPEAYSTPLGIELIRNQRPICLHAAVASRVPSFLDSHEWRTVPYRDNAKNTGDYFWDQALKLPRLMVLADAMTNQLRRGAYNVRPLFDQITELVTGIQRGIDQIVDSVHASLPVPVKRETAPSDWFQEGLPAIFDKSYHYLNDALGELIVSHWTCTIFNQVLLISLRQALMSTAHYDLAADLDGMIRDDLEELACNICKSLEFFLTPDQKNLRGLLVAGQLPIQNALRFFMLDPTRYGSEIEWCLGVGDKITSRGIYPPNFLTKYESTGESTFRGLQNL